MIIKSVVFAKFFAYYLINLNTYLLSLEINSDLINNNYLGEGANIVREALLFDLLKEFKSTFFSTPWMLAAFTYISFTHIKINYFFSISMIIKNKWLMTT